MTNETELSAKIESELNAQIDREIQAEMMRKREEIAFRLRRAAAAEEYNRINKKHPIETAGDPKVEAERRRQMDLRAKADMEHMDKSNSRVIEGSLLDQRKRAALVPGSEGFEIRPGRRS
jgi:hypothetical protein